MKLRPDEIAAEENIKKNNRSDERLKSGLKTAGSLAVTGASAGMGAKLMPFLSSYIPMDLALKGINKLSPVTGKFLRKGMKSGLDLKDGLNYLKESIEGSSKKPIENTENIIQQYSPELLQFLKDEIANGMAPQKAGAVARLMSKDFDKAIKQIEKDHKTDFSLLLQNIFGSAEQPKAQQEPEQMQQEQMQGQQGQQAGGVDPALMQVIQNMQNTMNKFRGG